MASARHILRIAALFALLIPSASAAQTTGTIIGRVVDANTRAVLEGATLQVTGTTIRGVTDANGRFLLGGVPPGERTLRVEMLGYRTLELEGVLVRTGQSADVKDLGLEIAPVVIGGVVVEAERRRLVEPDVSASHEIVIARELRELPVDRIDQVVELTPGVSGGHFRGGRVGQEVYVVDGVELKNQFEASSQGAGLELSPTSLEEVEVITGGFGAQYGSALSGVVSYVTRRGSTERWEGRASVLTDQWAPASMFYGFTALSVSAGGPLNFIRDQATLFVDVLGQGMLDADPRARGLACLEEGDASDTQVQSQIRTVRDVSARLACPYSSVMLPHQRGDKLIGFVRYDMPLFAGINLMLTGLHNRVQQELYVPEFRYSAGPQLGQRNTGSLATLNLNWSRSAGQKSQAFTLRGSYMRLDRYLGVVDPSTFDSSRPAGFGFGAFEFLGEDYARSPIADQLASPTPIPGYIRPTSAEGNPFGVAGEGIFFTDGTPHIASWAGTDMLTFDANTDLLWGTGSGFRSGASMKMYGIESYERTLSWLAGSSPNYARFYPATVSGFSEAHIAVTNEMSFDVGMRVDAFRSGLDYRADRRDFLSPVIESSWNISFNPRFGVAMPMPGTNGGTAIRFNYGYVAQPPDFRYFLDTAVGDSLRTDIRRQGNPALSFERGKSFELGVSTLVGERAAAAVTIFRKELSHLVTGTMRIGETGDPLYSTDDEGSVTGMELVLRGRWRDFSLRGSYALQRAVGVAAGVDGDDVILGDDRFIEYPLAFDRRHSLDIAVFYGRAAGMESPWSAALTSSVQSGYPIDREAASAGAATPNGAYLPWTSTIDLRMSRDLGRLPGCSGCVWRITADGRNLLNRENLLAVRRETGSVAPSMAAVRALVDAVPAPTQPVPAEAPGYTPIADLNRDGVMTVEEFRLTRTAAALGRFDPSLYFGPPRQIRLGLEVSF